MKATIDIIHTYNHCCSCKLNHINYNIVKICSVLSEVLAEHIHNHPAPSVEDHVLVVRRSTSVSTITVSTLDVTHKTFSACSWPRSRNVTMSLNIATSIVYVATSSPSFRMIELKNDCSSTTVCRGTSKSRLVFDRTKGTPNWKVNPRSIRTARMPSHRGRFLQLFGIRPEHIISKTQDEVKSLQTKRNHEFGAAQKHQCYDVAMSSNCRFSYQCTSLTTLSVVIIETIQ